MDNSGISWQEVIVVNSHCPNQLMSFNYGCSAQQKLPGTVDCGWQLCLYSCLRCFDTVGWVSERASAP